jgi:hypothetical protein
MRITKLWPQADWGKIWENLWVAPVPGFDIAAWYKVIHDVIPTNTRLHRIYMSSTDTLTECGNRDTILHRLTEWGEGSATWNQMRFVLARILRTTPVHIPSEWLIWPQFQLRPEQIHRAVLWLLARFVKFRMQRPRTQAPQELMEYLRRSRWKMYRRQNRFKMEANFLTVLD